MPDPKNIQPVGGGQVGTIQDEAYKAGYTSGYYDSQGNARPPSGFTPQMMEKLFKCDLPKKKEEFDDFYFILPTVIGALPRITNINAGEYNEIIRDWEDIKDLSASEGAERVVQSDMIKLLFKLRLLPARGDFPLPGLTAVSAIISSHVRSEQKVTMPQAKEPERGWFGLVRR
jgi:hypothetical protein